MTTPICRRCDEPLPVDARDTLCWDCIHKAESKARAEWRAAEPPPREDQDQQRPNATRLRDGSTHTTAEGDREHE